MEALKHNFSWRVLQEACYEDSGELAQNAMMPAGNSTTKEFTYPAKQLFDKQIRPS